MQELLALLLPVAAASGWYAAKRHYTRKYLLDHARPMTRAYRRGLNYLLSEKTDEAIDVLAHIVEMDRESLETHIALGNLFRRQGEVEKAIEVHSRLIDQSGLSQAQRHHALYELGVDYLRAGLFDRAEAIFESLRQDPAHREASLQRLLGIYQQEKDWHKAMGAVRELLAIARAPRGESVAQFLCELAEEALAQWRGREARDHLAQALSEDPACARASLIKARLDLADGDYSEALRALRNVEAQDPGYLPEILEPAVACYQRLEGRASAEYGEYLEYLYRRYGLVDAAARLAERIRDTSGATAAVGYLLAVLEAKPCLKGLGHAVDLLAMAGGWRHWTPEDLRRLSAVKDRLVAEVPRYRCVECGFGGAELHWRCPSCQHWGSMRPTG
jgi:lipopolysaccharide biosynthesis regulator YciM